MRSFQVTKADENQRMDKYLKRLLPNASTGFLFKMLRKKNIVLNGKKSDGTEILKTGDEIKIFFSEETFEKFLGDNKSVQDESTELATLPLRGIQIIYEDEDILAANKPINMLSQKSQPSDISANEILLGYLLRTKAITGESMALFRPGVCNRLDRNTPGLILMGKTLRGSQMLSEGLRNRSIRKFYRAVVWGTLTKPLNLQGYLVKDNVTNTVRLSHNKPADEPDAKPIRTLVEPIQFRNDCTLVEVDLITGKTHQIRAHLASIGHPIIGDPKYGDSSINSQVRADYHIKCQMLHAYRIELANGQVITAPLPSNYKPFV